MLEQYTGEREEGGKTTTTTTMKCYTNQVSAINTINMEFQFGYGTRKRKHINVDERRKDK